MIPLQDIQAQNAYLLSDQFRNRLHAPFKAQLAWFCDKYRHQIHARFCLGGNPDLLQLLASFTWLVATSQAEHVVYSHDLPPHPNLCRRVVLDADASVTRQFVRCGVTVWSAARGAHICRLCLS